MVTTTLPLFGDDLDGLPPRWMFHDDLVTEGAYRAWAVFSEDRLHRYLLGRVWDPLGPSIVLTMLNPSKAGGIRANGRPDNDPTILRAVGFAKRYDYGSLIVANASSLISTDPKALTKDHDRGAYADEAIRTAIMSPMSSTLVVAWGRPPNVAARDMVTAISRDILEVCGHDIHRFGELTKDGWPRHPLYLRSDTPIVRCDGKPMGR